MRRSTQHPAPPAYSDEVQLAAGRVRLAGTLVIPARARGLVLFAHGSGSSRHSPRNQHVAHVLETAGLATLLFDLLTREEEFTDAASGHLRFDIDFLADRLRLATRWVRHDERTAKLKLGYFGSSTGAAAALMAAAEDANIGAVASRGGRPDLAREALNRVRAPTLLIVGGADAAVRSLNEEAYAHLCCVKQLEIVPGATHLFEEPGALDRVAELAARWFADHLQTS